MALPIVQGSLTNTPASGVKMDSGALREAALAPGRLASAIGQNVGGLFEDVSQKVQQNRNAADIWKADLAMQKTKSAFTQSLITNPDEKTWVPKWQQTSQDLRQQILGNQNYSPVVKRHLDQMFNVWDAANQSDVRTAALLKEQKNNREFGMADATEYARNGQLDEAMTVTQSMIENHAMNEAEARKFSARFPTIAAQASADTAISSNPIKAPDLVKRLEGVMEPKAFLRVQVQANEARSRAQRDNGNDWDERLDTSPDGTVDLEELKSDVKANNITQTKANSVIARMQKKNWDTAKSDFNVLMMEAHDHNWTDDKTPEQTATDMKDRAALPAALQLRLTKEIEAQMNSAKKAGEKEERPVERQVLEQMQNDRTESGVMVPFTEGNKSGDEPIFSHRVQGGLKALKNPDEYTDKQLKEDFGPSATREKVMEAEKLHAAQMLEQMRAWFRDPANKNATVEQANKQRQTLERPWVMSAVSRVAAKKPRLVKQGGKTYDFDTGEEVK